MASEIMAQWDAACEEAELGAVDKAYLWRRQFLNDYVFDGYAGGPPPALTADRPREAS
jgi:serine/threonine-protein kinase HipA